MRARLVKLRRLRVAELEGLYATFTERSLANLVPPFPSNHWGATFPPFTSALKLDSIRPLLLGVDNNYRNAITQEIWDSNQQTISRDIIQYQRSWRAHLAIILRDVSGNRQHGAKSHLRDAPGSVGKIQVCDDGLPRDIVKADSDPIYLPYEDEVSDREDAANVARLNGPDAFFRQYRSRDAGLRQYPAVLDPMFSLFIPQGGELQCMVLGDIVKAAQRMVSASSGVDGFPPNATMTELVVMDAVFLCECCSVLASAPLSWVELVSAVPRQHLKHAERCFLNLG